MSKIYKYEVSFGVNKIQLPSCGHPVHFGAQIKIVDKQYVTVMCVWFELYELGNLKDTWDLKVVATGEEYDYGTHMFTLVDNASGTVWHLIDVRDDR